MDLRKFIKSKNIDFANGNKEAIISINDIIRWFDEFKAHSVQADKPQEEDDDTSDSNCTIHGVSKRYCLECETELCDINTNALCDDCRLQL